VVSPTVVLVNAPRVGTQRAALARLQALIAAQPGIALVLGAGDNPLNISFGAALATSGNAARYFVVLDSDPLGAQAISIVRHLQKQMPGLLKRAGLPGAQAAYAGDTALSAETINDTLGDLGRIAPVSLAAMLLILIIYLRALVAPLYLVAASMLSFAAALGITAYVFQGLLGEGGLSFFVPFIAAVLLISLGSDYNVFLIGNIWEEARRTSLRDAVATGATRSARAITLAGFILAGSFALLFIIPLEEFRQIALVMTIGLLLDSLLIRTILVPALVMIVGAASSWPSRRFQEAQRPEPSAGEQDASRSPATTQA
jgi:RND superfamily putative drug exporter